MRSFTWVRRRRYAALLGIFVPMYAAASGSPVVPPTPAPIQITHSNTPTDTFRPFGLSDDGQRVGWIQATATDYFEIGPWNLYVGDSAGVGRTLLASLECTDESYCNGVSLSGDGNTVAFAACDDLVGTNPTHQCQIYTIHSDGTGLRQVTSSEYDATQLPSLNYDGSVVAYGSGSPGQYSLVAQFLDVSVPIVIDPADGRLLGRFGSSIDSSGQRVAYQALDIFPLVLSSRAATTNLPNHHDLTVISGSSVSYILPGVCLSRDGTTVLYESAGNFTGENPNGSPNTFWFQAFVIPWIGGEVRQLTDGTDVQYAHLACNPMVTDGSRAALSLRFTGDQDCAMIWVDTATGVSEDIFPRSPDACFYGAPMVSGDGLVLAFGAWRVTTENPYGRGQVLVLHYPPICTVDGVPCDDRNACTQNDVCQSGACVGAARICDDGNACNGIETCYGREGCVASDPVDCDDHSICTDDSCDPASGCRHLPLNCDDGDPCTIDLCDTSIGGCYQGLVQCDDDSVCTTDVCDPSVGCVFTTVSCDDGNRCTDDSCDAATGCVHVSNTAPCDDSNACTTNDTCGGGTSCHGGAALNCDDANPCTTDSCNTTTGCVHFNNTSPCNDGNACTGRPGSPDACDGAGSCVGGLPPVIGDNDACTIDSCDPETGAVFTPVECDDHNVCNGTETCDPASGCRVGTPLNCNDGNACSGTETCDPATGCVPGTPVTCPPPDQCHAGGVCLPSSGTCTYANLPDGTTCDDSNATTTGDACQGGVCVGSGCTSTNDPKGKGWYTSLCSSGGHSGDSITDADAQCVGARTSRFAGFTTAVQVCAIFGPGTGSSACAKADQWFMALALNICKQRVCENQAIDSNCAGDNETVGESFDDSDALLSNPSRKDAQCWDANCMSSEIDNGHALELDTLTSLRESGAIRLNWAVPYSDDGSRPKSYKIYRRAIGSLAPFVQIGNTAGTTYLDLTDGAGSWQYEVTPVF